MGSPFLLVVKGEFVDGLVRLRGAIVRPNPRGTAQTGANELQEWWL